MALIKCIECGTQISDKSECCVHCGAPTSISLKSLTPCPECGEMVEKTASKCPMCGYPMVIQNSKIQCPECSTLVDEGTEECPECGFPIAESNSTCNENDTKQVETSSSNINTIIGISILSIFCGVLVLFFNLGMFDDLFKSESSKYDYNQTNTNSNTTEQYYDIGYEKGYSDGFAGISAGTIEKSARITFNNYYGAPSTDTQKKRYKKFSEGYTDGYLKGKNER